MGFEVIARIMKQTDTEINEIVLTMPTEDSKYWWIRKLTNGKIFESTSFEDRNAAYACFNNLKGGKA